MKDLSNMANPLMRRLRTGLMRLKRSIKRPVITLNPGGNRRRFERTGKYSTVVVRSGHKALLAFLFIGLLVSACTAAPEDLNLPDTGLTAEPGGGDLTLTMPALDPTTGAPQAVMEAVRFLSVQSGVSVEEIEILEFERVDWSNACLDVPQEGEACAEVITPGFRVLLEANGQVYELRTDEQGTTIRQT